VFNVNIDQDFDFRAEGLTKSSFCAVYLEWIQFCASKREKVSTHTFHLNLYGFYFLVHTNHKKEPGKQLVLHRITESTLVDSQKWRIYTLASLCGPVGKYLVYHACGHEFRVPTEVKIFELHVRILLPDN